MGSLGKRLAFLEEQLKASEQTKLGKGTSPREWERFFHAHENARRELHGLEPLPDLEYTEEDREDDLRTLEETIPEYRYSAGWDTEEPRAFLDAWEEDLKQRLGKDQL